MLAEYLRIPHLSVGNFLRKRAAKNDEVGQRLDALLQQGILIPTAATIEIIEEHLHSCDVSKGYILDGFPRNMEQAKAYQELLDSLGVSQNIIIYIHLNYEQALKRMQSRYTCTGCGESYSGNNPSTKSKVEGICDECGSKLVKRSDDNEESLIKRYELFNEQTYPLLAYYESLGLAVLKINGELSKEDITNIIINYFKVNYYDCD